MQRSIAAVVSLLIVGQMAVCSLAATHMEMGIARGRVRVPELEGRDIIEPVLRILSGGRRQDILVRQTQSLSPMVNPGAPGRQGISDSRLPQSTTVRDRDPAPWQSYRWYIVAGVTVIVVQATLIWWLLAEHRQRRRAEVEVEERLQEARIQLVTITHLDRRAAMGEVTAAITHELNQPLEAILHNAEAGELMLESGAPSLEEMRQIFADIRRIDMRAAEIIQRLRGLLRKKEFETGPVDVNDLARDTAALVTPVAGSKGVRVELDLATDLVPIVGDRIHLQQVLLNVLLNGIEAMSTTPRERRWLAVRTLTADHHVEISVRDRGHGIRAETVSRIFEPFYTTKGEGMGIGLSIARTIVEAHGGRIDAANNADGGATVSFTLPSGEAAVATRAPDGGDGPASSVVLDERLPVTSVFKFQEMLGKAAPRPSSTLS
jgi:signal transduction histidine kinase